MLRPQITSKIINALFKHYLHNSSLREFALKTFQNPFNGGIRNGEIESNFFVQSYMCVLCNCIRPVLTSLGK